MIFPSSGLPFSCVLHCLLVDIRGIDKLNFSLKLWCCLHQTVSLSLSAEQNNNRKHSLETLLLKRKEKHYPLFPPKTFFLLDFYKI
jgi:hypothetical protein